jgi:carboxymethylenebutenolidase
MNKNTKITLTILILVAIGGLFLYSQEAQAPNKQQVTQDQGEQQQATTSSDYFHNHNDQLEGQTVDYYSQKEEINGYLATPDNLEQGEQAPAIILIHEWWGLNEDIKQMADDYADEGYVALAVDMYGKEPTNSSTVAKKRSSEVRNNMEEAMNNLSSAVEFLENREDVNNDKLATVGWCFGGGWAYQMAVNDIGVDASVMYYGQFDPQDDFRNMKASILGHFGEEDTVVDVNNAREFKAKLEQQDESSSVYIYPNVGHSFANYDGGDNLDYSRKQAKKTWNRTMNFLQERLELDDSYSSTSTNKETYNISARESQAEFRLVEVLRGEQVTVVGTTSGNDVEGSVNFDPANPSQIEFSEIKINARTFETDSSRRDRAIRSFILDSSSDDNQYITFKPNNVSNLPKTFRDGETYDLKITGDLTIKDTTREVTFNSKVEFSNNRLAGAASTTINYSDYGINIPDLDFIASVEDEVELKLDFVAKKN